MAGGLPVDTDLIGGGVGRRAYPVGSGGVLRLHLNGKDQGAGVRRVFGLGVQVAELLLNPLEPLLGGLVLGSGLQLRGDLHLGPAVVLLDLDPEQIGGVGHRDVVDGLHRLSVLVHCGVKGDQVVGHVAVVGIVEAQLGKGAVLAGVVPDNVEGVGGPVVLPGVQAGGGNGDDIDLAQVAGVGKGDDLAGLLVAHLDGLAGVLAVLRRLAVGVGNHNGGFFAVGQGIHVEGGQGDLGGPVGQVNDVIPHVPLFVLVKAVVYYFPVLSADLQVFQPALLAGGAVLDPQGNGLGRFPVLLGGAVSALDKELNRQGNHLFPGVFRGTLGKDAKVHFALGAGNVLTLVLDLLPLQLRGRFGALAGLEDNGAGIPCKFKGGVIRRAVALPHKQLQVILVGAV